MIPVCQTNTSDTIGDCVRACIASIFEFEIEVMPNFWEQTQDGLKFTQLVSAWVTEHLGYVLVSVNFDEDLSKIIEDVLCIAVAKSTVDSDVQHAVVWQGGIVHDPHPEKLGFIEEPTVFMLFIPLNVR